MNRWTAEQIPNQNGRVILVTGANSGLGYETTLALARKGAQVIMACRNLVKSQRVYNRIKQQAPDANLELLKLDLSDLSSVRQFVEEFKARYTRLDVLINNAGVMAIPARKSADGFEMQFATNHLGHFALTGLLLDLLIETPGSRVVTVSSMMHVMGQIYFDDLNLEKKYTPYRAYGQSKLANVLFGFELQRRLEKAGANTISLVAHPGYAATNLQSNSADALGDASSKLVVSLGNRFMAQSQEKGALPQLYAATAPGVKGGEFYGPHFMGTRGYPKVAKANPKAYDTKVAAQLWAISEKLTGVEYNALKKAVTR